ncbi:ubiquinone-dependent pyruvate dehydrogenase, partial [Streptomyces albiflaviniger]|nr:ubiquinone-dependent pyruvate dehydrogenase [Streptomyces albiflaviniger]
AIGFFGQRVARSDELKPALVRALAHEGPALVDVRVDPMELSMPPKIRAAQVKGFSLYAARAVMNGRGDEIVELAKTNLLRRR